MVLAQAKRTSPRSLLALALAGMLLLAACSAASPSPSPTLEPTPTASPSPSPSPTVTPLPSPSGIGISAAAQAYLVPLPGYAYVALPAAVEQQAIAGFTDPQVLQAFLGYAIQSVTKNGVGQAVAWVLDVQPSYLAIPGTMDEFVAAMSGAARGGSTPVTLAGQAAFQVTTPSEQFVVWQTGSFIVVVFGPDLAMVTAVSTALIQAHA